jgi:putative inorganic carbon (hco3(-)) transporter
LEVELRSNSSDGINKNYSLLIFGLALTVVLTFTFSAIGNRFIPILFISILPIILVSLLNYRIIFSLLIISLFINLYYEQLSSSVWLAAFVPLSALICFRDFKMHDLKLPITTPLVIYILVMIISLINSVELMFSLLLMYNMLAFIFIVYTSSVSIMDKKEIISYIILFLILNLLNSFHVIAQGLVSSRREFGFAGIMFVDYVGIAITMNFILILINRRKDFRIILIISFLILIIALLITETRNAWISTFLSLFLSLIFLIIKSKTLEFSKSFVVVGIIISTIFLSSVFIFVSSVKPDVSERAQETTNVEEGINKEGQVQNSLLSRLLIWHTAYNAFLANPVIGIGAYSFPVSSQHYYTIPKFLFDDYVKGLTPHLTYIAVITETGIVGLITFIIFLISSLKFAYDGFRYSKTIDEKRFSFLVFWPLVYITISTFMTDAWLWGQGIVLWGIFLGINLWNRKRIKEKHSLRYLAQ